MPFYQRRGDVPRKRHIVFRENGALLTEEVMGLEGFSGNESILYHLVSPCRVKELGDFTPIEREEWIPETHAHRLQNTYDVEPEGDEISGRRTLMWNSDVEIGPSSFERTRKSRMYASVSSSTVAGNRTS